MFSTNKSIERKIIPHMKVKFFRFKKEKKEQYRNNNTELGINISTLLKELKK